MSETIGLYYELPKKVVGCKKVAENLLYGLRELNIKVQTNKTLPLTGCIHGGIKEFKNMNLPKNTLCGPELCVLPDEMPWMWKYYRNICQPNLWVWFSMRKRCEQKGLNYLRKTKQYVWPVGINQNEFNPDKRGNFEYDCFIYFKTVTRQVNENDLKNIENECKKRKLKYKIIKYGSYTENELKHLCNKSKFAIWLVGSESQNIAIGECMAMNIPIYVIDVNEFKYKDFVMVGNGVSSACYFDERCGIKSKTLKHLDTFLNNLNNYSPRDYILDNLTLKKGAEKYMEILRKCV